MPLLALGLVVILAGSTPVAPFGRLRRHRLGHALGFPHGKRPCANTLSNPFAELDADGLDRLIGDWLADRHADGWDHIALDGKTLRSSRDGDTPGVYRLAVYAPQASADAARLLGQTRDHWGIEKGRLPRPRPGHAQRPTFNL